MNNPNDPSINREILKNRLLKLEQEIQGNERKSRLSRRWIGSACAVAGLLVCCGAFFFRHIQDTRLFSRYYEPYPNVVSFVERGEMFVGDKAQALQLYDQGHYAEALEIFEDLYTPHYTPSDVLFYAAIACIETEELEKAQQYLMLTLQQHDNTFDAQAQWYMALIYLRKNDRKKARQHLRQLVQHSDIYSEKAAQLLKDL